MQKKLHQKVSHVLKKEKIFMILFLVNMLRRESNVTLGVRLAAKASSAQKKRFWAGHVGTQYYKLGAERTKP